MKKLRKKNILDYKTERWLISNVTKANSCRELFEILNILPVPRTCVMRTVYYRKLNVDKLEQNLIRHDFNTRQRSGLQSQFCGNNGLKKTCK